MLISAKKFTLWLLTMSLIAFPIVSCGEEVVISGEDTQTSGDLDETTAADTGSGNLDAVKAKYGNYADYDYEGYEFRILSPSPGEHFYFKTSAAENEIWYEAENGDTLNDAIYQRNQIAQELLNFELVPVWGGTVDEVKTTLQKSIMAASDEFDVVLNRLDYMTNQAAEGGLVNFYDLEKLDVSDPWWDKNIVESFTFYGNKLYALAGDINYYDDYAVQALFMNQRICEELGYELPYQLVRDGKWTFDEFNKMVKGSSQDLNGDGQVTISDDVIGYVNHNGAMLHMVFTFDQKPTITEADGTITINNSEPMINTVDILYRFLNESGTDVYINTSGIEYTLAFPEGRVLFFAEMIGAIGGYREMVDDYSVLPMPKGDESMTEYRAYVSNGWTTSYAIPNTNTDIERSATILDTMCAASTDTVMTALYDVMLTSKLIRDEESQEMLEYIFASKCYDISGDLAWGGGLTGIYLGLSKKSTNTFVSDMDSRLAANEKALEDFLASFAD